MVEVKNVGLNVAGSENQVANKATVIGHFYTLGVILRQN
jgi:hypothetical protein